MLETLDYGVFAEAGGDGEGADVIAQAAGARRDEIGERDIGAAFAAGELLAQRVQRRDRRFSGLVGKEENVVAVAVRRPQADHRTRCEPAFGNHSRQHGLRIGVETARRFAQF